MDRLERISIKGYRRLHSVDVELRPLTVMIGANGAGKTSLLEVFALLAASAAGRLQAKISDLGGISDILTRRKPDTIDTSSLEIGVRMALEEYGSVNYEISLVLEGQTYRISHEVLEDVQKTEQSVPYLFLEPTQAKIWNGEEFTVISSNRFNEPMISEVRRTFPLQDRIREHLASIGFYGPIDVSSKSPVRLPQQVRPATLPGQNGEDLVSYLHYLRENYPDRLEAVEESLAVAFPDFERLGFPSVAAGTLSLTWKDKNFTRPFYMHQLSEGTLRFLWLVALLQSPELPAITLIDEPEVSLHPELLQLLVGLLREASERAQIVVATQSDRLIRFLEPEEVLVLDSVEGYTTMHWADTMDIEHWLAEYSLDEVWRMGRIGGRA